MKVSLIGDSIRMNSEKYTLESLPQDFEIESPAENCESSSVVIGNLDKWIDSDSNLVHLNCGLHDIRFNSGYAKPVTAVNDYLANLNSIFSYLSTLDGAIIWATSTPFVEAIHNEAKESKRYVSDLILYNELSVSLAKEYGFYINDLFSKLKNADYRQLLLKDGIHYNQQGNKLIGKLVAESIMEAVSNI